MASLQEVSSSPFRTTSLEAILKEVTEEFRTYFPQVQPAQTDDTPASVVVSAIANSAKSAFGAYRTPKVQGFQEQTVEDTIISHLNWDCLQNSMEGMLKIQLKDIVNKANPQRVLDTPYHQPYVIFTTGDSRVKSTACESSDLVWNSTHYLPLRKQHIEADIAEILSIVVYAKDTRGGLRSLVNRFKRDDHIGRADIKLNKFRKPGIHEQEVAIGRSGRRQSKLIIRFSVEFVSVETALNELGKEKTSNEWSETSFDQEIDRPDIQWPELAERTNVGQINLDPVAFVDAPTTGSQAWIHVNNREKLVVIAFRGTSEKKDFFIDARCLPAPCSPAMKSTRYTVKPTARLLEKKLRFHTGFREAYVSIRESILRIVYDLTKWDASWTVGVTGHSLGGALATICAFELANRELSVKASASRLRLQRRLTRIFSLIPNTSSNRQSIKKKKPNVFMINFGAPPVGNLDFARLYSQSVKITLRVFTEGDPVVKLKLPIYTHIHHQIQIREDGEVHLSGRSFNVGRDSMPTHPGQVASVIDFEDLDVSERNQSSSSAGKNVFSTHLQPQYFRSIGEMVNMIFNRHWRVSGHALRVTRANALRGKAMSPIEGSTSLPTRESTQSLAPYKSLSSH